SGITADGSRAFAHQFHAVVIDGVVAGSNTDATVDLVIEGGKVNLFGSALANVQDVGPGIGDTSDDRLSQFGTAKPYVMADHDATGLEILRKRATNAVGNIAIQLVRYAPTNVVSLEAGKRFLHYDSSVIAGTVSQAWSFRY